MRKKLLTLDDLVSFCKLGKLNYFNSNESGFKLFVQVPATFKNNSSYYENFDIGNTYDNSMLYGVIKAFHTELNRNGSYIPHEAAVKAMQSMKYKPILAYIHNFGDDENEDYDFTSHEINVDDNGDLVYIESQVGCFTSDAPYMQYDEEYDKTFIYAKVAIPRTYTKAADIIERKGGTKVSVELSINSMSWDNDNDALILEDFIVEGCTLLGRSINNDYGSQVEEGMQGAKFILDDFKEDSNSIVKNSCEYDVKFNVDELKDTLEKLHNTLSAMSAKSDCKDFEDNINNNSERKEEKHSMDKSNIDELFIDNNTEAESNIEIDTEVVNDNNFESDKMDESSECDVSNESETSESFETEIETKNEVDVSEQSEAENTSFDGDNGDNNGDNNDDNSDDNSDDEDEEDDDENVEDDAEIKKKIQNAYSLIYELSHREVEYSIYKLLCEQYPNECNDIVDTFDDHFILYNWDNDAYFIQKYSNVNNVVTFIDERVQVFPEFLTSSEVDALNLMRNTYQSMESELNQYKLIDARNEKIEKVQNNSDYELIKDDSEFIELIQNMDNYSLDELITHADLLLAKHVKASKSYNFSANDNKSVDNIDKVILLSNLNSNENDNGIKPYGGIFENYFNKNKY